ncbi:MAG TPA: hypothetical protein PKE06_01125 [Flavilitoribacter sp.]|nr:hypothetical protein [Flavilitoribacter sp.]HMQ86307.1 hypothetical protein [Flavilitoribacter sp.]
MENSKLIAILHQLDKLEINKCRKFIHSPYFNSSLQLNQLFDFIVDHLEGNGNGSLPKFPSKEKLWQKLNPRKKYDDARMRKYLSDLLKLVEGFLTQQAFDKNPLAQSARFLEAVEEKKLTKLYNSAKKTSERVSTVYPYRNTEYYYYQYVLEKHYYGLTDFESKREDISNVEEISKNLDFFYFGEKLRLYCEVLSRRKFVNYEYQIGFIDIILNNLENQYDKPALLNIYYRISKLYTQPENEGNYKELINLLNELGNTVPPIQARDELYMAAQNYCVSKINSGHQNFAYELFSLYKAMLANDIITAEGELPEWFFKNIAAMGLRLREYDWIEKFIFDYQHMLPENVRSNAVSFNLAQLYFYQKKYDRVIEQLRNVEYENVMYNLNSKTFLLATYFEMDEIEPLYSFFDTFRTYLNRRKDIPESRRKPFLDLIRFTKRLTKVTPKDKRAIETLKDEIIKNKNVASRNWLLEKIQDLEN